MPSKRQREQRNAARAASVEFFKKRRLEASSPLNSVQLDTDNDKLSTTDTSDEEVEPGTWFWNESANETDSDSEEEGSGDVDKDDSEDEQSKMKQAVSLSKIELRWNKRGEENLRSGYGKGSRSTQMKHNKSARDLEKEASKTYNIRALWQRNRDIGTISQANSQVELEQPTELQPSNSVSSIPSLSQTPRGCLPPLSKQQVDENHRIEALKDLTRLLELVTEQEKKYENRLSPQSNFYRRHLMVQ